MWHQNSLSQQDSLFHTQSSFLQPFFALFTNSFFNTNANCLANVFNKSLIKEEEQFFAIKTKNRVELKRNKCCLQRSNARVNVSLWDGLARLTVFSLTVRQRERVPLASGGESEFAAVYRTSSHSAAFERL